MKGLEQDKDKHSPITHLHCSMNVHFWPQSLIPGPSTLWGSTSYFWRPREAHHFISFQKVPTLVSLLFVTQVLPFGIKDYSILSSQKKRNSILTTCFHSYHQSIFQKGLSLNCQEIASSGQHRPNPLGESSLSRLLRWVEDTGDNWSEATLQPCTLFSWPISVRGLKCMELYTKTIANNALMV